MNIRISGRLGQIIVLVLAVIVGAGMVFGFTLPAPVVGVALVIGAILWLAGA